jgi:hypothetical protein
VSSLPGERATSAAATAADAALFGASLPPARPAVIVARSLQLGVPDEPLHVGMLVAPKTAKRPRRGAGPDAASAPPPLPSLEDIDWDAELASADLPRLHSLLASADQSCGVREAACSQAVAAIAALQSALQQMNAAQARDADAAVRLRAAVAAKERANARAERARAAAAAVAEAAAMSAHAAELAARAAALRAAAAELDDD